MAEKLEQKSRYCKKRSTIWTWKVENGRKTGTKLQYYEKSSTSVDKARFQGIIVSVLTVAFFLKKGETQIKFRLCM